MHRGDPCALLVWHPQTHPVPYFKDPNGHQMWRALVGSCEYWGANRVLQIKIFGMMTKEKILSHMPCEIRAQLRLDEDETMESKIPSNPMELRQVTRLSSKKSKPPPGSLALLRTSDEGRNSPIFTNTSYASYASYGMPISVKENRSWSSWPVGFRVEMTSKEVMQGPLQPHTQSLPANLSTIHEPSVKNKHDKHI